MKLTSAKTLILIFSILSVTCTAFAETSETGKPMDPALQAIEAINAGQPENKTESPTTAPVDTVNNQESSSGEPADATMAEPTTTTVETPVQEPETPVNEVPAKDVIMVLDNSGSMKKNDPQFLANQAVNEFINQLDAETRIAIIIFDQSVRYALPMTEYSTDNLSAIKDSLKQLDYKGKYTDSPAAMERAIYDLKTSGRPDAKKIIIFMTDGIVDTGNKEKDIEKSRWLKQDLAADAADSGIQIFGIAFTEDADFELIQSLAQKTDGEYYRALKPDDLTGVFDQIHTIINKVPEPEVVQPPPEPAPVVQAPPPPPPKPVIIHVPAETQTLDKEAEFRSRMILVALTVLILAVIIMVLMLIRGSRRKQDDDYAQEAFLNDPHNYTGKSSFKLGKKPTMLGRVAGTDADHLDYIVIPETTIGRRHALIEYKDFAYWIIDQGSINGTYVNDVMVTSETRLKHGDRIRLHKCEFEFSMPEMADAGMTVISKTVLAANPGMAGADEDVTVARGSTPAGEEDADFDLSEAFGSPDIDDDEETLMRENEGDDEPDGSDETIMMDDNSEPEDDDATIRPDMVNEVDLDMTVDRFTDEEDDEKKKD